MVPSPPEYRGEGTGVLAVSTCLFYLNYRCPSYVVGLLDINGHSDKIQWIAIVLKVLYGFRFKISKR